MSRMLDADHLVRLPILSGSDAVALGTALETRAQAEGPLPPPLEEARADLAAASDTVQNALESQVHKEAAGRPLVEVDRSLNNSWGAGRDLCRAWMRLPQDSPQKAAATRIHDVLFKDGLAFTQLNSRDQWVESESRLNLITEKGLEQDFTVLAAGPILASIRQYHQEYGDVQGVTATAEEDQPMLAEGLQGFRAALRYYVLQVVAHARPKDPASQELSRSLLLPLSTWQSLRRSSTEDTDEPADDTGAPGATDAPPATGTVPSQG